jgi:hypothetical protein
MDINLDILSTKLKQNNISNFKFYKIDDYLLLIILNDHKIIDLDLRNIDSTNFDYLCKEILENNVNVIHIIGNGIKYDICKIKNEFLFVRSGLLCN